MKKPELNDHQQPINSPITQGTAQVPWKYGIQQGLQYQNAKFGKAQIVNPYNLTPVASGLGTVVNGGTLRLSGSLVPQALHSRDMTFAVPYTALYLGTAAIAGSQLYPQLGTGVTGGTGYIFRGDLDHQATDGTNSYWSGYLLNNSGAQATVSLFQKWRYIGFNTGTVNAGVTLA